MEYLRKIYRKSHGPHSRSGSHTRGHSTAVGYQTHPIGGVASAAPPPVARPFAPSTGFASSPNTLRANESESLKFSSSWYLQANPALIQRGDRSESGKVIFSLRELPVGEMYITERGTPLRRVNDHSVMLGNLLIPVPPAEQPVLSQYPSAPTNVPVEQPQPKKKRGSKRLSRKSKRSSGLVPPTAVPNIERDFVDTSEGSEFESVDLASNEGTPKAHDSQGKKIEIQKMLDEVAKEKAFIESEKLRVEAEKRAIQEEREAMAGQRRKWEQEDNLRKAQEEQAAFEKEQQQTQDLHAMELEQALQEKFKRDSLSLSEDEDDGLVLPASISAAIQPQETTTNRRLSSSADAEEQSRIKREKWEAQQKRKTMTTEWRKAVILPSPPAVAAIVPEAPAAFDLQKDNAEPSQFDSDGFFDSTPSIPAPEPATPQKEAPEPPPRRSAVLSPSMLATVLPSVPISPPSNQTDNLNTQDAPVPPPRPLSRQISASSIPLPAMPSPTESATITQHEAAATQLLEEHPALVETDTQHAEESIAREAPAQAEEIAQVETVQPVESAPAHKSRMSRLHHLTMNRVSGAQPGKRTPTKRLSELFKSVTTKSSQRNSLPAQSSVPAPSPATVTVAPAPVVPPLAIAPPPMTEVPVRHEANVPVLDVEATPELPPRPMQMVQEAAPALDSIAEVPAAIEEPVPTPSEPTEVDEESENKERVRQRLQRMHGVGLGMPMFDPSAVRLKRAGSGQSVAIPAAQSEPAAASGALPFAVKLKGSREVAPPADKQQQGVQQIDFRNVLRPAC